MPRTLLLAVLLLAASAPLASAQDVFDDAGEAAMLDRINALRGESQLAPLVRLDALDGAARAHSAEMARTGQLSHVSDATGSPEDRVREAGVGATRVTENVASHRDAASANEAVMGSPAHRQNALDPNATHIGLGAVRTEQGVFVTQLFATLPAAEAPVEEAAPEAPPAPAEEAAPQASLPSFELIPPFVEQAMQQAAPMMQGMLAPE
ncbi:MAG: CAP domain-containing protein, partial [Myxococcales bacterium]|nr:CAP domain-containing protein [Myxococcales bacterium]